MSRLQLVNPANAAPAAKAIFDGPLAGKHFNIFKAMANSPAALEMYVAMGGALSKASLSLKERETIQLVMAEANNCAYCAAAHTAIGKSAGLSEAQTIEARRGKMQDPKLDALAKFTLAIHEKKGFIADADLAAFKKAGYGDGAAAEVVATYAQALYTNIFNHMNDTPVDFPPPPAI